MNARASRTMVELKPPQRPRSDVATITSDDADLVGRAQALSVGYTPAPGFSRRLDRWAVQRELVQAFPGVELSFAGSEACRVVPETRTVRSTDLVEAARAELAAGAGTAEALLFDLG